MEIRALNKLTVGAVLIITFSFAHEVYADVHPQDSAPVERDRFLFGVAIGAGYVDTDVEGADHHTEFSPSIGWKIGWIINRTLAAQIIFPSTFFTYDGNPDAPRRRLRGFEGIVPTIQYWPGERFWVSGGIGLGSDTPVFFDVRGEDEGKYYFGVGGALSVGYELWQRNNRTIDVQTRLRYGTADVPEGRRSTSSVDILVGINWY